MRYLFLIIFLFSFVQAEEVYVDTMLTDSTATYSIANRDDSGSDGRGYVHPNDALLGISAGDTIYLRAGQWDITDSTEIDIPEGKNGSAGEHTYFAGYPEEVAILDGGDGDVNIIKNLDGYNLDNYLDTLAYWQFERLTVTNGNNGFWMKGNNIIIRYCDISENKFDEGDGLKAGIFLQVSRNCTIEYNRIYENQNSEDPILNNGNIIFDADQRDTAGDGSAPDSLIMTRGNIVRFNYVYGSKWSVRDKNQQRFGLNSRNPADIRTNFPDWGNEIAYNIILNAESEAISMNQDNVHIHHNIADAPIGNGKFGDTPILYNGVQHNNTVLAEDEDGIFLGAGVTEAGTTAGDNYYYNGVDTFIIQPNAWITNNIVAYSTNFYRGTPLLICVDMPANETGIWTDNWDDLYIENNLFYDNTNDYVSTIGRKLDAAYDSCEYAGHTLSVLNSCNGTNWQNNWENNSDLTLFLGVSGPEQYTCDSMYVLTGTDTLYNSGKGGNHPFETGVTIPSYVGAAHQGNNLWVSGVLDSVTSSAWRITQTTPPNWLDQAAPATPQPSNTHKVSIYKIE